MASALLRPVLALVLLSLGGAAHAQPSSNASPNKASSSSAALDTVTISADRERAIIKKKVDEFVSGIVVSRFEEPLKRWRTPICPLVAGLPRDQGEFFLERLSRIAMEAGAPLAPEKCKGNLFLIMTSVPEDLLRAWTRRDTAMFSGEGASRIRNFINNARAVRVWYNATFVAADGSPLAEFTQLGEGILNNTHARGFRLAYDEVPDIDSVLVIVDTRRAHGISFNQLSGYVSMVGLAEVKPDVRLGDNPSVLSLFSIARTAPETGLSAWDQALLHSLYHTDQADKMQLAEMKTTMVREVTKPGS